MVLFFFPERVDAMAAVDGSRKEPRVQKEPSVTSIYTGESSSAGAAGRMKTPEVLGGALFYAAYIIKKSFSFACYFWCNILFADQVEHMQSTWGTGKEKM
jgi:hypothetical protein